MDFKIASKRLKGIPFISHDNARTLYNFIVDNKCKNILELGIGHGTSSAYIAAALDKLGEGKLTCVDLESVRDHFKPSAEELLSSMKLDQYVEIHRMKSGYNWFLHNDILSSSNQNNGACKPKYDLVIIDGPKNWTIDSSSFFLADKLLEEKGWILWDDYNWTYKGSSKEVTDGISIKGLSMQEQEVPHIKEIFHLLVMQHEKYSNFLIQEDSGWAWAQKVVEDIKTVNYKSSRTLSSLILGAIKKLIR